MSLFLGTFENKVDKKGRISVPAQFRAALSTEEFQGIVAYPSFKYPAIEACGISVMADIGSRMEEHALFSDEQDDLALSVFADAHQLPFDGEGRIILPPKLREHAGILDDGAMAAFVGAGPSRFYIWNPGRFAEIKATARNRSQSLGRTLAPIGRDGGGRPDGNP